MNENEVTDEICISYDTRSKSIAFYNVATKNRIRYTQNNYYNLTSVMKHIDSVKPLLHWPRRAYPLRVFIDNLRYLNNTENNIQLDRKEALLRGFWENLWSQMQGKVGQ